MQIYCHMYGQESTLPIDLLIIYYGQYSHIDIPNIIIYIYFTCNENALVGV